MLVFKRQLLTAFLYGILQWIKMHPELGVGIYLAIGIPWVTICLPGSTLSLCAGIIFTESFGKIGIIVAWICGIVIHFVAGQISFYIARFLLYKALRGYFQDYKPLKLFEAALKSNGYKMSLLLRFAAFFPYMILNYGLSITAIAHKEYMLGFIGGWPWELLIIYYGYCIGNVLDILNGTYTADTSKYAMLFSSLILSIIISIYVVRLALQEIQKMSADDPDLPVHVEMIEEKGPDNIQIQVGKTQNLYSCLLYTSPSPRDATLSRMPSSA
eukprot:TRINITY_DN188_c0_g3_i1.p1 TRINITY_DN188_c0_g3~~TRINITY_DN188_c0_g3_i1.p1  ORF type:complete len:271 (+),score=37.18 TRINITY_DN188_c0_g3_i1:2-814(+)